MNFKTQVEIIRDNFIPLVANDFFQAKKYSFYITRVYYTDARIAVFARQENINDLVDIVKQYTKSINLNPFDKSNNVADSWDGKPRLSLFKFERSSADTEEVFYTNYLEDITRIGLDLHIYNLKEAIKFAVNARFKTRPFGELDPRKFIGDYLAVRSQHYANMTNEELDRFWGNAGFEFSSSGTVGSHFFYNIILGKDYYVNFSPISTVDPLFIDHEVDTIIKSSFS